MLKKLKEAFDIFIDDDLFLEVGYVLSKRLDQTLDRWMITTKEGKRSRSQALLLLHSLILLRMSQPNFAIVSSNNVRST